MYEWMSFEWINGCVIRLIVGLDVERCIRDPQDDDSTESDSMPALVNHFDETTTESSIEMEHEPWEFMHNSEFEFPLSKTGEANFEDTPTAEATPVNSANIQSKLNEEHSSTYNSVLKPTQNCHNQVHGQDSAHNFQNVNNDNQSISTSELPINNNDGNNGSVSSWQTLTSEFEPNSVDLEVGRISEFNTASNYYSILNDCTEVHQASKVPEWIECICDSGATSNLFNIGNGKAYPPKKAFAKFGSGDIRTITHSCDQELETADGCPTSFRTKICPDATRNLISMSRMQRDGWVVTFHQGGCVMI